MFKGKTDKNGKIKVRLRYGKYILTETIAPEGYIKATKNLEIVVNKDGAKIEQILWNEPIPTQPEHLPKSGINKETGLLVLVGLIIGCGLYFTKKAKKGDKYVRR